MSSAAEQIDVRASAASVLAALTDLQGYLSSAVNPDRIALAELGMEPMGWTKHVYGQKAFDVWQAQLRLFPDDPLIRHHMAIMHHARAFDLESGSKPADADADWHAAMEHWHRLHGMDAFWELLTNKACAGTARQDVIKKLRADFPQMILAVHYDIALDPETRQKRKSRAKCHVGMVHSAPFDAREREEAQRSAYNRYIKAVPDEVWQPNELREEVLDVGQKAIIEYLDFDPGCVPALEDALRLQRRVQRSRNTLWRSLDNSDPKRAAILRLEKKDADAWRPFFDQLLAVADHLDEDVREDLARWYCGRGSDLTALDQHETSVEFFERAVRSCRPDGDDRQEFVRELVQAMAVVARKKVAQKAPDARSYCDKLRGRDDLTIVASWLLAQAYTRLRVFDAALAVCDRGLGIEPAFDDLEADTWLQRLAEFKREIPVLERVGAARSAMEEGDAAKALPPLNAAETLAREAGILADHNSIYWMRAQAHLALDQLEAAKRDTNRYLELLDDKASPADIKAGKTLQEMVAAKEQMGNIKPLLEQARKAMEGGRFKDALAPLDDAVTRAPKMDVIYFLRAQALCAVGRIADAQRDAKTLAGLAQTAEDRRHAQELNAMIEQAQAGAALRALFDKAKQAMQAGRFKDALSPLNDAAKKAPDNDAVYFLRAQAHLGAGNVADAKRDAKKVRELAESDEDRKAAAELEQAIDRHAARARVQALLKKAQTAMQNGSFHQAAQSLNEAADLAPTDNIIYFLRAQARMGSQNPIGALEDARKFESMATTTEERDAAKRLMKALLGGQ